MDAAIDAIDAIDASPDAPPGEPTSLEAMTPDERAAWMGWTPCAPEDLLLARMTADAENAAALARPASPPPRAADKKAARKERRNRVDYAGWLLRLGDYETSAPLRQAVETNAAFRDTVVRTANQMQSGNLAGLAAVSTAYAGLCRTAPL